MDSAIVSGFSAVFGSLVGGGASIVTAWFTQRAQSKREATHAEIRRREVVYTEFISEGSKLLIDALDHSLDNPSVFIQIYGLLNRIRLTSSDSVVDAAEKSIEAIIERYFLPNLTVAEFRARAQQESDPLKGFSEACRNELRQLLSAA